VAPHQAALPGVPAEVAQQPFRHFLQHFNSRD